MLCSACTRSHPQTVPLRRQRAPHLNRSRWENNYKAKQLREGEKNDVQTLKESARKKKRAQARPPLRTNAYITRHCVSIHLLTYIHRHTLSRKARFRTRNYNSAMCCLKKTKWCSFFREHILHFLVFYFSLKSACNDRFLTSTV